ESAFVPHIGHAPLEDALGQSRVCAVKVFELRQRNETLSHAVPVYGISAVVKIPGRAILAEEVLNVEFVAQADLVLELVRIGAFANRSQPAEVVTGVEIINPLLGGSLAVRPRTVLALFACGIAGKFQGRFQQSIISRVLADAAEQSCAKK